jgi:hypothetical protein
MVMRPTKIKAMPTNAVQSCASPRPFKASGPINMTTPANPRSTLVTRAGVRRCSWGTTCVSTTEKGGVVLTLT